MKEHISREKLDEINQLLPDNLGVQHIVALCNAAIQHYIDHSEQHLDMAATAVNAQLVDALEEWERVDVLGREPHIHRESWKELVQERNRKHTAALAAAKASDLIIKRTIGISPIVAQTPMTDDKFAKLTTNGAKAWAGVDAQDLRDGNFDKVLEGK